MKLQHYTQQARDYLAEHRQGVRTTGIVVGGVAIIALFVGLYAYNAQSKLPEMTHKPLLACNLFTEQKARALLGEQVISQNPNGDEATISGNRATSKCSYTDKNPDSMAVAAIAVRSALNDEGWAENQADFAAQQEANKVELVTGVGDEAFFIPASGQLNVLHEKSWLLITYGRGDSVATYTLNDAVKLAQTVLNGQKY